MKRILIIEDDAAIRKGLTAALQDEHYEVLTAGDGEEGYQTARREKPDAIILDLMLPKKNGQDVCRELRKEGIFTPILMLTSKKQEMDKVLGLELGADDYVTKPFGIRELLARIKALLRRKVEIVTEVEEYSFGSVQVDFKKLEASKNGKPLKLTAKEFEILKFLVSHEREVVRREVLLDKVWGYESFPTTRTVDTFIASLRKKIENDPSRPKHLLTVPTVGYKFVK
ncbi:MAG: response regulator transcription factor [candidate division Zixibacteria bacterium]|nr:response regulator transcription factor [candidate division Zixibacteria bacterium]